jgi:glycerophosphoryl diester phosphodiesterase
MHDATLNRTTNAEGKLADYTWNELQQFNLVDHKGKATAYKIPSLEHVIEWARGKTILNLDKKDVPLEMTADLLEKTDALAHVMLTVHHPSEARYYLNRNKDFMFSAFIRTKEEFEVYESEKIPWKQDMAYVGPLSKLENRELYDMLHKRGVMVMVSAASSYDKLENSEERTKAYTKVFEDGADVLESDLPIDVAGAIRGLLPKNSPNGKYFGVQ